jgi:hypothetical protein
MTEKGRDKCRRMYDKKQIRTEKEREKRKRDKIDI